MCWARAYHAANPPSVVNILQSENVTCSEERGILNEGFIRELYAVHCGPETTQNLSTAFMNGLRCSDEYTELAKSVDPYTSCAYDLIQPHSLPFYTPIEYSGCMGSVLFEIVGIQSPDYAVRYHDIHAHFGDNFTDNMVSLKNNVFFCPLVLHDQKVRQGELAQFYTLVNYDRYRSGDGVFALMKRFNLYIRYGYANAPKHESIGVHFNHKKKHPMDMMDYFSTSIKTDVPIPKAILFHETEGNNTIDIYFTTTCSDADIVKLEAVIKTFFQS